MVLERQHGNECARGLTRLNEPQTRAVLLLVAHLQETVKQPGCRVHGMIHRWLSSGAEISVEPDEWLREQGVASKWSSRQKDAARRSTDRWIAGGLWCALRQRFDSSVISRPSCPSVVFGVGSVSNDHTWVSVFNSRVPRLRSSDEKWLEGLRMILSHVSLSGIGLLSSTGTLTYDLVTAHADRADLPLMLWLPASFESLLHPTVIPPFSLPFRPGQRLTCLTGSVLCDHSTRSVCRDRMLAELSDIHCLLRIRKGGNLEAILEAEQSRASKPRWHVRSRFADQPEGRSALPESRSVTAAQSVGTRVFKIAESVAHKRADADIVLTLSPIRLKRIHDIDWSRVLCHYTRACVGPWPGERYESYLAALLDGEPQSGHSAFHTLIRMTLEDKIRASAKLLKGASPAISFTSIAPMGLSRLRQWNKSLARWTVEPYGLGIDRTYLKRAGIKPVIYGPPEVYNRLREQDRFRFQKHVPPDTLWKHEREWRFPRDLALSAIPSGDRLLFVPTAAEAAQLARAVGEGWAVVALAD